MDDPAALYGSAAWVAACFGKSKSWFLQNRERLEAEGFPRRDPIIGTWIKADVIAFISSRRQVRDCVTMPADQDTRGRIRLDRA